MDKGQRGQKSCNGKRLTSEKVNKIHLETKKLYLTVILFHPFTLHTSVFEKCGHSIALDCAISLSSFMPVVRLLCRSITSCTGQ